MTQKQQVFKVLVVGASSSGKTSLICRFVDNSLNVVNTTATPCSHISISMKVVDTSHGIYFLELWDVPSMVGSEEMLKEIYMEEVSGVLLVVDGSDRSSFQCIADWLHRFKDYAPINSNGEAGQTQRQTERRVSATRTMTVASSSSSSSTSSMDSPLPFPVVLVANKADLPSCVVSSSDMAESAANFGMNAGFLVSTKCPTLQPQHDPTTPFLHMLDACIVHNSHTNVHHATDQVEVKVDKEAVSATRRPLDSQIKNATNDFENGDNNKSSKPSAGVAVSAAEIAARMAEVEARHKHEFAPDDD